MSIKTVLETKIVRSSELIVWCTSILSVKRHVTTIIVHFPLAIAVHFVIVDSLEWDNLVALWSGLDFAFQMKLTVCHHIIDIHVHIHTIARMRKPCVHAVWKEPKSTEPAKACVCAVFTTWVYTSYSTCLYAWHCTCMYRHTKSDICSPAGGGSVSGGWATGDWWDSSSPPAGLQEGIHLQWETKERGWGVYANNHWCQERLVSIQPHIIPYLFDALTFVTKGVDISASCNVSITRHSDVDKYILVNFWALISRILLCNIYMYARWLDSILYICM